MHRNCCGTLRHRAKLSVDVNVADRLAQSRVDDLLAILFAGVIHMFSTIFEVISILSSILFVRLISHLVIISASTMLDATIIFLKRFSRWLRERGQLQFVAMESTSVRVWACAWLLRVRTLRGQDLQRDKAGYVNNLAL